MIINLLDISLCKFHNLLLSIIIPLLIIKNRFYWRNVIIECMVDDKNNFVGVDDNNDWLDITHNDDDMRGYYMLTHITTPHNFSIVVQ